MSTFDTANFGTRITDLYERLMSGAPLDLMGLDLSQKSQDTLYGIAYLKYQQAKYDDAKRIFAILMTINHMDRRLLMGFGACLQMQRIHKEALEFYGAASILDLTDPEPVMRCVECHLALGDVAVARTGLEYGLAQARAHTEHNAWVDRFETMLGFLNNAAATVTPAAATQENANV